MAVEMINGYGAIIATIIPTLVIMAMTSNSVAIVVIVLAMVAMGTVSELGGAFITMLFWFREASVMVNIPFQGHVLVQTLSSVASPPTALTSEKSVIANSALFGIILAASLPALLAFTFATSP